MSSPVTPDQVAEVLGAAPFFEDCSADQVRQVIAAGAVETHAAGQTLWRAGDVTDFFLLVDGELAVTRTVGADEVTLLRTGQPGAWGGSVPGVPEANTVSGQAVTDVTVLRLACSAMETLLVQGVPVAMPLLRGLNRGVKEAEARTRERERLVSLGKLAAELNHELNNPAAAAARATERVRALVSQLEDRAVAAGTCGVPVDQLRDRVGGPVAPPTDPLARSDAEEELADHLRRAGVEDPYGTAAGLLDAGVDPERLDAVLAGVTAVGTVVDWLRARSELQSSLGTLDQSVGRIVDLVGAVKRWTRMGRAQVATDFDLHDALDATVTLLGHKLRGRTVRRDYDGSIATVHGNAGELNQVWMNLLDNAADAAGEGGTITLRTRNEGERVVVEVEDDGHGIPADVLPRIFEPFFTTKDVGDGLGLGLDTVHAIVTKHHAGEVVATSEPGRTVFRVELPRGAVGSDA